MPKCECISMFDWESVHIKLEFTESKPNHCLKLKIRDASKCGTLIEGLRANMTNRVCVIYDISQSMPQFIIVHKDSH